MRIVDINNKNKFLLLIWIVAVFSREIKFLKMRAIFRADRIRLSYFLRTVLTNKAVLIFDEPTSNMDKTLKPKILKIIEKYASDKIVIIVTHDKLIEKDILDLGYRKEEIVDGYSNC